MYLVEGFGNATRIDYGSGHEMAFVMFLYCLFKIKFLTLDDRRAVGLLVFDRYPYIFVQHRKYLTNPVNKARVEILQCQGHYRYRYMKLMRKLQTTYRMEPAGSHGVWSLDDYQFVPFIWGSSQLIGNYQISLSFRHGHG